MSDLNSYRQGIGDCLAMLINLYPSGVSAETLRAMHTDAMRAAQIEPLIGYDSKPPAQAEQPHTMVAQTDQDSFLNANPYRPAPDEPIRYGDSIDHPTSKMPGRNVPPLQSGKAKRP